MADDGSGSGTGILVANGDIGTGVTEALCVPPLWPCCDWLMPCAFGGVVLRFPDIGPLAEFVPGPVEPVAVVVMMPPCVGVCDIGGGIRIDAPPTVEGTGV